MDGIAAGANNYTHPSTHAPAIIEQDASNRFVTDAEKTQWNAAEANQNAFSSVAVSGQSTASASSVAAARPSVSLRVVNVALPANDPPPCFTVKVTGVGAVLQLPLLPTVR